MKQSTQTKEFNFNKKTSILDQVLQSGSIEIDDASADSEIDEISNLLKQDVKGRGPKLWQDDINLPTNFSGNEIELDLDEIERVIEYKKVALSHYRKKRYIESLENLEKAIKLLPGDLDLLFYQGMCLFQTGNYDRACGLFEKLLELDKTRSIKLLTKMHAMSLLKLERFAEAKVYLERLSSSHPYDNQIKNMLGFALERQNMLDQAEPVLASILEDDASDANACNSMAFVLYRKDKNIPKAMTLIKRALEREPNNPSYLDTFGLILHKKGNLGASRKALQRAYDLSPDNKEIQKHISQLFR